MVPKYCLEGLQLVLDVLRMTHNPIKSPASYPTSTNLTAPVEPQHIHVNTFLMFTLTLTLTCMWQPIFDSFRRIPFLLYIKYWIAFISSFSDWITTLHVMLCHYFSSMASIHFFLVQLSLSTQKTILRICFGLLGCSIK